MIGQVAAWLVANAPVLDLLAEAIAKGASREALMRSIRAAMVEASDEKMRRELGPFEGGP